MSEIMVRYTVHPDRVAENEKLVRAVYEELQDRLPDGFRYATFRIDGGATFVHIASVEEGRPNPLADIEAFQRFQDGIADRCVEDPTVTTVQQIGAFRFYDGT